MGAASVGFLALGCSKDSKLAKSPVASEGEESVTPSEDLMREHGVLNRILLIYEEGARKLEAQQPFAIDVVEKSAGIVRRFIEQYHEKLEEDFLFVRFEKANKLVDLVTTLRKQHAAGRIATETTLKLANAASVQKDDDRRRLIETLRSFVRMYRPHAAREDTVLFPALHEVFSSKELHDLGEQFEDKEHELFGKDGFEGVVVQVGSFEQTVGLYELNQFTLAS